MVRLTVTFLGTSSAAPTEGRGLPGIAIQREGEVMILDCGEGVQREIIRRGIGLNKETTVLISHLHGDHVTGLLGLLQTMSMAQRSRPLTIVGPESLTRWLSVTNEIMKLGLTFDIRFVPARAGTLLKGKTFTVRACRADHSVEAYCYRVDERPRPGTFHPEKARALGIPEGKLWSSLQKGRSVRVGRRRIRPSEVIDPSRPGRSIGYSGDTRPSGRYTKFFEYCDLLIFDSTFSSKDSVRAVERKHSTAGEAAEVARRTHAGKLVLTHFSARYKSVSSLVREARKIFPNTIAAYDGLRADVEYPSS
ncbi:MAG TPA: ribonuclease Z [Nitrososphaerales archaeon]|nr:ribonuclease Z [Nitrososphaerales archaeon]